jgi:beta-glucosidase
MTFEQKVGQMTQADIGSLNVDGFTDPSLVQKWHLGSVLVGGDSCPDDNGNILTTISADDYEGATMEGWRKLMDKLMNTRVNINGKYEITMLSGTDAVHGNQHIIGEVLFPHNIGLAASHNTENFENAGYWTAESVLESGFNYIFAPCVAVSHNAQWSRYYESLGYDVKKIYDYAKAFVNGA